MRIEFDFFGDVQVSREILRVGRYGADASPALRQIGELMQDETRRQFESQGIYASAGWTPLKPATIRAKQRKGQDLRILHMTHRLRDSLTGKTADSVMVVRPDELRFGTKVPYAGAHQNPRAGSRLPRRRPIEFRGATRTAMVKILQRWIITGELSSV